MTHVIVTLLLTAVWTVAGLGAGLSLARAACPPRNHRRKKEVARFISSTSVR